MAENRYNNVLPEEHSRVKLSNNNFYINANYIFCEKNNFFFENNQENNENQKIEKNDSFIACQAPLFFTRSQFWSMIWDENSSVIVMLTDLIENGKSKADIYWPTEINNWVEFSEVAVLLRKVQFRNDIVIRHLSLKKTTNLEISFICNMLVGQILERHQILKEYSI